MPLTLELFDGFRLFDADRQTIRVPDRRARALIASLALAERAVPRLALAELLCSEGDEQDQRAALRQAIYVAKKATAHADLFVSADDAICLDEAVLVSDVRRFEWAIARGDRESLNEAVELYRGPLLAGERSPSPAFEDWLSGRRSELLEQVVRALLTLAESDEAAGEHDRALAWARRALTLEPLREDARRQAMRSLAALGQRAAALREYESGRQLLADELQVGPDDDTEALRDAISRGEETRGNGPSAPTTSRPCALAGGASSPDQGDRGQPGPFGRAIGVRRAGALRWTAPAIAAILALVVAGWATWWYAARPEPPAMAGASPAGAAVAEAALPLPDKPSIAVLPFDNMSGDPEQEYFVDGLTYDVITSLARFKDLFVIARHSSFQYKAKAADVRNVGRELGVRYVVEGSVHKSRDRLSVTAKLIEAATARHLWVERYDRPLVDVFEVRDEIIREITGTLGTSFGGVVNQAELLSTGVSPAERLRAYDYLLRGMYLVDEFTQEGFTTGIAYLEQAIELNPDYAKAYGKLAIAHYLGYLMGFEEAGEALPKVAESARAAIAADRAEPWAWWALAYSHLFAERRHDQAIEAMEKAVALNPNDADMLCEYGWMLAFVGRAAKGIEHIHDAMRLSPRYPGWYFLNIAWNYLLLRDHEAVVATVAKQTSLSRLDRLYLAASYSRLDRLKEARAQIEQVLDDDPSFTIETFLAMRPIKRTEDREYLAESLKRAGLPEGVLPLPDRPSIAVLPFENLSGDPKQQRLADGITEWLSQAVGGPSCCLPP